MINKKQGGKVNNYNIYEKKCRGGPLILILIIIFNFSIIFTGIAAQEWKQVLSPDQVKKELVPESKLDKKISLDYKDADLATVLRSLSWTYDLNIVTGPKVKGKVTISLKDVAVRDALEAILTINGLIFSEREGIVYVAIGDPEAIDMDSQVIFLKYITASEALNLLRDVGSSKGNIKINEVSNSLVVTDFSKNIAKIKKLLVQVDIAPQQVLIEARIVDITSSDLATLGFSIEADYNPGHGIFDRGTSTEEQLKGTINMAGGQGDLSGGQLAISTFTMKDFSIPITIDALVRDGKAKLLASPSIAVLNGEEARILIGTRYPISERTQTTTGTTETVNFVDVGTSLRVTPTINDDGYITMRIHPEVSSSDTTTGNPTITTREADTTVRVKEGETLIIGGLIKNTDNETHDKIPILGDIPFIGRIFSRFSKTVEQIELAVFITPKILRSQEEKERLSEKAAAIESAYGTFETTGELVLVESLFGRARALDRGVGIESIRKSKTFRKTQALNIYKHIAIEFPGSDRAAEAVYRAGMIHYKDLKDYDMAGEVFAVLISDYPKSEFSTKARKIHKKLVLPTKDIRKPRPVGLDILSGNY